MKCVMIKISLFLPYVNNEANHEMFQEKSIMPHVHIEKDK